MIICSAVQLRQSKLSAKWADLPYFNASDDRFAKSQLLITKELWYQSDQPTPTSPMSRHFFSGTTCSATHQAEPTNSRPGTEGELILEIRNRGKVANQRTNANLGRGWKQRDLSLITTN
jgi:hypothetical protein